MIYKITDEKSSLANREGWVSIFVNLLLFTLKYWAGVVSGSLALIADAWHTLSDSISSVMLLIGLKFARKPADKNHPFGHGRSELVTSLLIGSLLGFVAFYFANEGIAKLWGHESTSFGLIAIIATVISVVVKEALVKYAFYIGKKSNSLSVLADGWHHRSDAISSVVVLIGIFLGKYFWWIDGVLSIIVALLILYSGVKIFINTTAVVLGEEPNEELIGRVKQIVIKQDYGDLNPHHFHIHNYVMHQELTFHVNLPNQMVIEDAHRIISNIEHTIKEELGIDATIHIEPLSYDKQCMHID